ncbi:MAG: ABC transporter permease [Trueperaceae bacterium]|nr:ABC transporter permease [Trueperaceae bacterium]
MYAYVIRRLLWAIPVLVGITFTIHTVLSLTPGDPVRIMLGETATEAQIEAARAEIGLDRPFLERYGFYLGNVIRGDLGESYRNKRNVSDELLDALPATAQLAVAALVLIVLFGIPTGVISAVYRGTWIDAILTTASLVGLSMPVFWIGLLLIYFFGFTWPILPIGGMRDGLASYVLPAFTLALNSYAMISRLTRSEVLETLGEDYIRTARAKGLAFSAVVWRHALKASFIPIVTVIGLQFGLLLGGAVLTETVFSWPGIGRLMVDAIMTRDLLVVQGAVLVLAIIFVAVNLAVDLIYAFLDPRIRFA